MIDVQNGLVTIKVTEDYDEAATLKAVEEAGFGASVE